MSVVKVGIIGQNTKRTLKLFSSIKKKKKKRALKCGGNKHFHSMLVNMPINAMLCYAKSLQSCPTL